jgi:hypothetical protein
MGSWKPSEGPPVARLGWWLSSDPFEAWTTDPEAKYRGVSRSEITTMCREWRAGRISDDMVRAALPTCWLLFGSTLEAPEMLALLRGVGPISDSPERPMPSRFRIYQGRASGEPIGITWSPDPETATIYSKAWRVVRAQRGADLPAVIWTGTVRDSDVLLLSRISSEVIVPPEAVDDLHEISGPIAACDPFAWTFVIPADYRAACERQAAGWVRYVTWRRSDLGLG